jgi:hypothetical protein
MVYEAFLLQRNAMRPGSKTPTSALANEHLFCVASAPENEAERPYAAVQCTASSGTWKGGISTVIRSPNTQNATSRVCVELRQKEERRGVNIQGKLEVDTF